jgi:hypothetical protein
MVLGGLITETLVTWRPDGGPGTGWISASRRRCCGRTSTGLGLRFVRNRADALPLNTWLGIEPHDDVDGDHLWRVLN